MFEKIIIVCIGNICRSPIAERLLKRYLPHKIITSAGIAALVGKAADPMSCIVAKDNLLSLEGHVAKQLTNILCREYDLILTMEKKHISYISQISPEAKGKTMLFGHWNNKKEIPDPYKKSAEVFKYVYQLLDNAAFLWANELNK